MKNISLIDTSAWIDFFKIGKGKIANEVDYLIRNNMAAICGIIKIELCIGLKTHEKSIFDKLMFGVHNIITKEDHFDYAKNLAYNLGRKGKTIPASDILIYSIAKLNDLSLISNDKHFYILSKF
jgi:predicted nucleic acid-binding protein